MALNGHHPADATVLARILRSAESAPDAIAWRQVEADGSDRAFTRRELVERAAGFASSLDAADVHPASVVPIIMPHDENLAAAWLGTLMHGAIPTILAEPSVRMQPDDYREMLRQLLSHLVPAAVIVDGERSRSVAKDVLAGAMTQTIDATLVPRTGTIKTPAGGSTSDHTVALQHSSGTTGRHKGVLMTNAQVLGQIEAYATALRLQSGADKVVSWLPLYHDMGFIAAFVMPLVYGMESVQMSPFTWITRPWMLFSAITKTRATLTWQPNFAFHYLASRVPDQQLVGVDLSSLRQVINCSEPCTPAAFGRFADRFAPYGLSRRALGVSYASAETIFAVTEGGVRRPLVWRSVDPQSRHKLRLVDSTADDALNVVGCGTTIAGAHVSIRDSQMEPLPTDQIGEVWVSAPYLTQGYFRRPDLDEKAFRNGWYRTGDLGCLSADGELFITGRSNDLIIVGGVNITPEDIEELLSSYPGVIPGRVVAIGVWDANLDSQRLVVLLESSEKDDEGRSRLGMAVRRVVAAWSEVPASDVRIYPRGVLRKSTSGKLSRSANLLLYEKGLTGDMYPTPKK